MASPIKQIIQVVIIGLFSIFAGFTAIYLGYDQEVIEYLIGLNCIFSIIIYFAIHAIGKYNAVLETIVPILPPALLTTVVCSIDYIWQTQIALQLYIGIPILVAFGLEVFVATVSKDKW